MREHLWRSNWDTIMRKAATSFINYSTMTLCIPSFLPSFLPSPPPPPSFIFWFSFHFSGDQNRKSPSTVFFCSETKRKRLLRRLDSVACVSSFDEGASVDTSGFRTGFSSEFSVPCVICTNNTRLRKLWKVRNLIVFWL